ncbi:MAG: flagellin lysine-N-methylase [Acidobacteriaceae bacterium]
MPASFTVVVPEYSMRFRCIGAGCEDDCCHGWAVPIDQPALTKYRTLPPGALRSQLDACLPATEPADAPPSAQAASIRMLPSGACPFLTQERLCRIHQELGPSWLSQTCAQFPRRIHRVDGIPQVTLALSCPEAARLVLLDPALLASPVRRHTVRWNPPAQGISLQGLPSLRAFYWPIREFVTGIILERGYALWQRLFLLGIFCQRLDAIARGQDQRAFPDFLRDFTAVLASGSLRAPMAAIPGNPALQLQLVSQLLCLGVRQIREGSSLAACLSAFTTGIGSGEDTPRERQVAAWTAAYAATFEPFFHDHPWILENYLSNELLASAFPFGDALFHPHMPLACMESFAQLAVRFGILQGLLIGVAAARGSAFSTGDVVQTVAAVSRQLEHSRSFPQRSSAFLRENHLTGIAGLTALLRN